jgi:hypothetical protein
MCVGFPRHDTSPRALASRVTFANGRACCRSAIETSVPGCTANGARRQKAREGSRRKIDEGILAWNKDPACEERTYTLCSLDHLFPCDRNCQSDIRSASAGITEPAPGEIECLQKLDRALRNRGAKEDYRRFGKACETTGRRT